MQENSVRLISVTPNAEEIMAYCARVSNPVNQDNPEFSRLINYCIKHGHWSIFEQANMVVEINTSRAIAAQILRHRSFAFQEFSQRYAEADHFKSTGPAARIRRIARILWMISPTTLNFGLFRRKNLFGRAPMVNIKRLSSGASLRSAHAHCCPWGPPHGFI